MHQFIFATYADPLVDFDFLFILANSIRSWTGNVSNSPIVTAVDEDRIKTISEKQLEMITQYDIEILKLKIDKKYKNIPYHEKTLAAGQVEKYLMGKCKYLIWMDVDSVFLNFNEELLTLDKALACRPVDLKLIGSEYNKDLSQFWKDLLNFTDINQTKLYSVCTSVDKVEIYPYYNAGLLIVDPKYHVLGLWSDNFENLALHKRWEYYYAQNPLYRIFLHQTMLAISILSLLEKQDIHILDYKINYSLRNHDKYSPTQRINRLNDLISFRIDDYLTQHDFSEFKIEVPLDDWINQIILKKS